MTHSQPQARPSPLITAGAAMQLGWWSMTARLRARRDEAGASLVEYALLVGLIAIVCFVAIQFLGGSVSSRFDSAGSQLTP